MFNGANLPLYSDVDRDTYMFGSHERSLTYRCIISMFIHIKIKKRDETEIRIRQYIQLNTGAKQIQQLTAVCLSKDVTPDLKSLIIKRSL